VPAATVNVDGANLKLSMTISSGLAATVSASGPAAWDMAMVGVPASIKFRRSTAWPAARHGLFGNLGMVPSIAVS
jgi:hypothetical protein